MPLLRVVLGRCLRAERIEQGLGLREVALAAAVSVPYLSEVERGVKEPSSEVLAAVCRALGLGLPELLAAAQAQLAALQTAPVERRHDGFALAA